MMGRQHLILPQKASHQKELLKDSWLLFTYFKNQPNIENLIKKSLYQSSFSFW